MRTKKKATGTKSDKPLHLKKRSALSRIVSDIESLARLVFRKSERTARASPGKPLSVAIAEVRQGDPDLIRCIADLSFGKYVVRFHGAKSALPPFLPCSRGVMWWDMRLKRIVFVASPRDAMRLQTGKLLAKLPTAKEVDGKLTFEASDFDDVCDIVGAKLKVENRAKQPIAISPNAELVKAAEEKQRPGRNGLEKRARLTTRTRGKAKLRRAD